MAEGVVTGQGAAVADRPLLAERPIRVVLIQIRSLPEAKRHEVWCVRRCTGLSAEQLFPWNVVERPELPWERLRRADAIIIGGSGDHSVTKEYPFMPWLEATIRRAVADAIPLFGICWGHHLLARALGGRVITDPGSEEVGTFEVELTGAGREDPLFDDLPSRFPANLVHHDSVVELPAGFHELAVSDRCRFQAMRLDGLPIYGTQFHGEMTPSQLRKRLLMYRGEYLETEEQAEEVVDRLRPTDQTYGLLRRFLELYT
jgi:GMP synthase (glutamine-hydrolysing)